MNNQQLKKAINFGNLHMDFITGIFVSDSIILENARYLFSRNLNETWVNCASGLEANQIDTESFTTKVIQFYQNKNRNPSVFLLKDTSSDGLISNLKLRGFKLDYSDSLMTYEGNDSFQSVKDFLIKKVENKTEMNQFIELFYQAHTGANDEVYGEADKEYRNCFMDSFLNPTDKVKREFYIGFLNKQPVSYGVIFLNGDVAGLYAIGTIPERRKKGLARVLSITLVNRAKDLGAVEIFLLTETGSINEKIYAKMGFKSKFVYLGYSKKSVLVSFKEH